MLFSDLQTPVDKLSKMLNTWWSTKDERDQANEDALVIAEDMVMNYLRDHKNISSKKKIKMVYDYWKDNFTSKDSLIDFLSVVLDKQYKSKDTLNNDLSELKSWWDVWDRWFFWWLLDKLRENIK